MASFSWTGLGGHTTAKLNVPKTLTIILLPGRKYLAQYIRANWLSNRVFEDYDAIIDAGCEAWNQLIEQLETIKSIAMRKWAHVG